VLREFKTEAEAVLALGRMLNRSRAALVSKPISRRRQRKRHFVDQMELDLGSTRATRNQLKAQAKAKKGSAWMLI
jgi:superoxide dismutase